MSTSSPPIREPWRLDDTGKLVSLPWILWLQRVAEGGQAEDLFSDALALVSTAEGTTQSVQGTTQSPSSSEVELAAITAYTPSSSSVLSNDAEMMAWMSF